MQVDISHLEGKMVRVHYNFDAPNAAPFKVKFFFNGKLLRIGGKTRGQHPVYPYWSVADAWSDGNLINSRADHASLSFHDADIISVGTDERIPISYPVIHIGSK